MKKKVKFKQEFTKPDQPWTEPIFPVMTNYHMACCDCGLVHTINFTAVEILKIARGGGFIAKKLNKKKYRVSMVLRRNHKLTKQIRHDDTFEKN